MSIKAHQPPPELGMYKKEGFLKKNFCQYLTGKTKIVLRKFHITLTIKLAWQTSPIKR